MFYFTIIKNFLGIGTEFISKYWKQIAVLTMISVIIYQNTFETRVLLWIDTIPYLREELVSTRTALDAAVDANEVLTAAIETTNKQIEEWKELSVELEKDNAALSGELKGLREQTLSAVQDILDAPTPESCTAAIDLLRTSIYDLTFRKGQL